MTTYIFNQDWEICQLDDLLCYVIGGDWGKEPDHEDENYELVACIRGAEFKNWKNDTGATAVSRKIKRSSLENRNLQPGDILIEISGGGPEQPVGRTVLITEHVLKKFDTAVVGTNFLRLARPYNQVSSKYLNYFLTYFYISGQVVHYQGGSNNLRNLKFKEYSAIEVPFASFYEQKEIADLLDKLLAKVEATQARLARIPDIIKQFRQSVLTAAVSGKLTNEWRKSNNVDLSSWIFDLAKNLCDKVQSGSTPKDNPFGQNGKIPFLKVYNIVNQRIDFDYKPQFVTSEVHSQKLKRSVALPDDVLMNIVGPPLGKVALLTNQYPEWNINQAITLFRTGNKKLIAKFLYFVLCEGCLVREVLHDVKGIVGQVNISLSQCREAVIPCPSLKEQAEIVSRVEQLFAYADTLEQQAKAAKERVDNLTQAILAKAFRGELTSDWRTANPDLISGDNSAAALLARIQAERATASGKKGKRGTSKTRTTA
ncbi:restriction endonuclease subunit S [Aeromonas caviae]|uniref:restriction endonuclease subunit S n=1 Tax=Aeromonas caviae TaxID=648 RepID=UPI0038D0BBE2